MDSTDFIRLLGNYYPLTLAKCHYSVPGMIECPVCNKENKVDLGARTHVHGDQPGAPWCFHDSFQTQGNPVQNLLLCVLQRKDSRVQLQDLRIVLWLIPECNIASKCWEDCVKSSCKTLPVNSRANFLTQQGSLSLNAELPSCFFSCINSCFQRYSQTCELASTCDSCISWLRKTI